MGKAEHYDNAADLWLAQMEERGNQVVFTEETLWEHSDGHWEPMVPHLHRVAPRLLADASRINGIAFGGSEKALWRTVEMRATDIDKEIRMDEYPYIVCINGVLDPDTGDLYDKNPELYVTRSVDIAYDPDAKCPEWLAAVERALDDKEHADRAKLTELLQEFFGVAIVGKRRLPRALRAGMFLYGPQWTGKSSVAAVLAAMFPKSRVCISTVGEISGRFGGSALSGKVAWIGDEAVGSKTKMDASLLKRLLDGEPVLSERKYRDAVPMTFDGPVLWTGNNPLRVEDEHDALLGRVLAINFSRQFTAAEASKQLGKTGRLIPWLKEHDEFPGILNWALDGYRRAKARKAFVDVPSVRDLRTLWLQDSSPVADFIIRGTELDKGVTNSVRVLSVAASYYAEKEHGGKLSRKDAARQFAATAKTLRPGIETSTRGVVAGKQGAVIKGLALNEWGQQIVELAKKEGAFDTGEKIEVNKSKI